MDRRTFIAGGTTLSLLSPLATKALAAASNDSRFVLIILRGALDGLAAVPAWGEPRYRGLRGTLALPEPGNDNGVIKLDGLFGLHPSLVNMHRLYRQDDLVIAHAVASPYRERSHFDGQKVLEAGGATPVTSDGGWLNRALAVMAEEQIGRDAIALADSVPLVLRGPVTVSSWTPSRLPDSDEDTLTRIQQMYTEADPGAAMRLSEALKARDLAGANGMDGARRRNNAQLGSMTAAAGRFLAAADGPRIAVIEADGWDTHANQGAATGTLANRLSQLDAGIANLESELGDAWDKTTVVVATEFGRTVAVNGTRGTDHGTGGVAFVAGGAINGGRVIADWPGLAERDLYKGRDLRPTLDLRSIFIDTLGTQYGLSSRDLHTRVFPGSAGTEPIGLFR